MAKMKMLKKMSLKVGKKGAMKRGQIAAAIAMHKSPMGMDGK